MAKVQWSQRSLERLRSVVDRVEGMPRGVDDSRGVYSQEWGREQWLELIENLDAGGDADAHPLIYSAAADSNKGDYQADASRTVLVRDFSHQCYGLKGERILARPKGTAVGTVWEPMASTVGVRYGKLDGSLASGGNAVLSLHQWIDGAWTDATENLTVYAPPLLSSGSIPANAWCEIGHECTSARWYVVAYECV